jgi:VanZ family protein
MTLTAHARIGAMPDSLRSSRLARYLLVAYAALVAYASLHPFAAWRDPGVGALAYLAAPLPRYVTAFDLVTNFLAYFPLGFLAALGAYPGLRGWRGAAFGALVAFVVSFTLEALQSYLPARIPSNLDLATNAFGGIAGAFAGTLAAESRAREGTWRTLRERLFREGHAADLGLVLLFLWLVSQLDPQTLLFGNGDVREFFAAPTTTPYPPSFFVRVEAVVTAANLGGLAIVAGAILKAGEAARRLVLTLVAVALVVRSLAFAVLFSPQQMFAWATPGAGIGLLAGLAIAALGLSLPGKRRAGLAALLLLAAIVVVNGAPENPYVEYSLAVWQKGHFLNFHGVTRFVSSLWPFAAIAYLVSAMRERTPATG